MVLLLFQLFLCFFHKDCHHINVFSHCWLSFVGLEGVAQSVYDPLPGGEVQVKSPVELGIRADLILLSL